MLRLRLVLVLLSLSLSGISYGKTIEQYLGHVKTISANFIQVVYSQDSDKPIKSSGELYVASPNKFRLVYVKPYAQVYVADGKRLWSYEADLEQVTVKPQQNMLANSPAIVLSDPKNLGKAYTVKYKGIRQGITWFSLTPRTRDSGFDHVLLGFKDNKLYGMVLFDSFGQKTELRFSQLKYNTNIPASKFIFIPPKGVDVVGDTGRK